MVLLSFDPRILPRSTVWANRMTASIRLKPKGVPKTGSVWLCKGLLKQLPVFCTPKVKKLNIFRNLVHAHPPVLMRLYQSTYVLGHHGTALFILSLCWEAEHKGQKWEQPYRCWCENTLFRVVGHPSASDSVRLAGRRPRRERRVNPAAPGPTHTSDPDLRARSAPRSQENIRVTNAGKMWVFPTFFPW